MKASQLLAIIGDPVSFILSFHLVEKSPLRFQTVGAHRNGGGCLTACSAALSQCGLPLIKSEPVRKKPGEVLMRESLITGALLSLDIHRTSDGISAFLVSPDSSAWQHFHSMMF
jgi:hypothetical protein